MSTTKNASESDKVIKFCTIIYKKWSSFALSFILPLILMVSAILLDFCSYEYIYNWEHIFKRTDADYAVIAPLAFVIWAFTASLVLFYIERFEEKHYGIRLIDSICEEFSFMKLCAMIVVFLLELLTLFWSTVYKKEITFFISVILQIGTMVYVFLTICVERSQSNILDRIEKQTISQIRTPDHVNWMMKKMLRNTDYGDEQEVEVLINLMKNVLDEVNDDVRLHKFMCSFTNRLLIAIDNKSKAIEIIRLMVREWTGAYAKRGIISSLIDNTYELNTPDITEVINIEFEDRKEVLIWGLAYNEFHSLANGESIRRELTVRIQKCFDEELSDSDKLKMYGYWLELIDDNANNSIAPKEKNNELEELHLDKLWALMYPDRGKAL